MELVSSRTALCLTRGGWACGQPGQAAGPSLCSFSRPNTPRNRLALVYSISDTMRAEAAPKRRALVLVLASLHCVP